MAVGNKCDLPTIPPTPVTVVKIVSAYYFIVLIKIFLLMARWGEGDPRWIVEEREDAKNVNNWHWYEPIFSIYRKDHMDF